MDVVHIFLDADGFDFIDGKYSDIFVFSCLLKLKDASMPAKLLTSNRCPDLLTRTWLAKYEDFMPYPEAYPNAGETWVCILHPVIAFGSPEMLRTFLNAGADTNGETRPLHCSIYLKKIPAIKILLEYGATIRRDRKWWRNTLKLAARTDNEELYDIVREAALKTQDKVPTFRHLKTELPPEASPRGALGLWTPSTLLVFAVSKKRLPSIRASLQASALPTSVLEASVRITLLSALQHLFEIEVVSWFAALSVHVKL
jgi:hypothetical protein